MSEQPKDEDLQDGAAASSDASAPVNGSQPDQPEESAAAEGSTSEQSQSVEETTSEQPAIQPTQPVAESTEDRAEEQSPAEEPVAEESTAEEPATEGTAGEESAVESAGEQSEADQPRRRKYQVQEGPLELIEEAQAEEEELKKDWYILKVMVNRETTIGDALRRKIKIAGMEKYFGDIVVPTEDVTEYTKEGKKKIKKKKLYPGYIMVNMAITDESWFIIRETQGIGDFTGSGGKPAPMLASEVEKIIQRPKPEVQTEETIEIPYQKGDRVRVKEGYFQNYEGNVDSVDPKNGRCKLLVEIFGRPVEVDIEYWNIEPAG